MFVGVTGGLLVQDADLECKGNHGRDDCDRERKPSAAELADMNFRLACSEACQVKRDRGC